MKKYTASNKWSDPWFFGLSHHAKQVIGYLQDNCDHAGVWDVNLQKAEIEIGFSRLQPTFRHPEISGIIYTTKAIAIEDVGSRSLDIKTIEEIPVVDWKQILTEINTPYQHALQYTDPEGEPENQIQIEPLRGGRKWWLVKFIRFQYGNKDGVISLNESTPIHIPVIRALRSNGILERFRKIYPSAQVLESAMLPAPEPYKAPVAPPKPTFQKPTLKEVMAVEIKGDDGVTIVLPDDNRKEFFYNHTKKGWRGIMDWMSALVEWAIRWERMQSEAAEKQNSDRARPETITEKKIRLEAIEKQMIEQSKNRYTPEGGTVPLLKPEAKVEINRLKKIKEELEKEIIGEQKV